jgi:hypothetical protein
MKLSSKYLLPPRKELELLEEKIASRRDSLKTIKTMKKEAADRLHETRDFARFKEDMRRLISLQRHAEMEPGDLFKMFLKDARKKKELYVFLTTQKAQNPTLTDEELTNRYAWFSAFQNRFPSEIGLHDATGWELTEIETWLSLRQSKGRSKARVSHPGTRLV